MRDQQINTFHSGMQQDLANTVPQEGAYIRATNIRIVAGDNGGASSGIITGVKGAETKLTLNLTLYANLQQPNADGIVTIVRTKLGDAPCQIKGYTILRNSLILFSFVPSKKFVIGGRDVYSKNTSCIHSINLDTFEAATLIYENRDLNFGDSKYISAVGRYESEDLQRIYWTDGVNPVRSINIKSKAADTLSVDDLVLNPPINFGAPKIVEVTNNGTLPAGMYQYCYRLKGADGKSTRFSPLSNFTHIVRGVDYWEYEPDPESQTEYSSTPVGEETDKSVSIKISNIDTSYDTIEIIAIYKTNPDNPESVLVIDTLDVSSTTIRTRHTNNKGTALLLEEITAITSAPSKAKVLAAKDNRLFLGGVTYDTSNLEFDARAVRYKREDGELYPRVATEETSTYIDPDFDIFTLEGADAYTIEENLNAVNPFNAQNRENLSENAYKFHPNGLALGGKGKHVEYTFFKKRLEGNNFRELPETSPFMSAGIKTSTGQTERTGPSYYNQGDYKSPANATEFVGYRRDEVYRFGVVLYDLQGNPGFVNWIGDIRFPDHHDYDHDEHAPTRNFTLAQQYKPDDTSDHTMGVNYHYNDSTVDAYEHSDEEYNDASYDSISRYDRVSNDSISSTDTHLFALGLELIVNIPEELQDKISGYRVVRVERDLSNRTVLGSGIANYLHKFEDPDRSDQTFAAFGSHEATTLDFLSDTRDYPAGYTTGDTNIKNRGVIMPNVFSIDAPDWPFEGYPSFDSNTYLKVDGAVRGTRKYNFTQTTSGGDFRGSATIFCQHALASKKENLGTIHEVDYLGKLNQGEDGKKIEGIDDELGVFNRTSFIHNNDYRVWGGVGEETLLCVIQNPLDYEASPGEEGYLNSGINWGNYLSGYDGRGGTGKILVTVKRNLGGAQYGGDTKLARSSNSYIPAGPFISMKDSIYIDEEYNRHEVWGGDTYVVLYDIEKVRKFHEPSDSGKAARDSDKFNVESVNFAFPVESSVNTALRAGWHFANKEDWDDKSETPLNTFELDNVYSSQNTTEVYISKPNNFQGISEYDTRIVYSDPKINNTPQDAWLSYRVESYKDLDGNRGALTSLLTFKDTLYFFQENGLGALAVNPTSTVIDNSGTSIVLGTGGVIQNFQYLSNKAGVLSPLSVAMSEENIYFADVNLKKIYSLGANGIQSISDAYGMKSWASENLSRSFLPVLGFDPEYNEVLIVYKPSTFYIAFSESINRFISFRSCPLTGGYTQFIQTSSSIYGTSGHKDHRGVINFLNTGALEPPSVEFIVNKNPFDVKVFDVLEWYSDDNSAAHTKHVLCSTPSQISVASFDASNPSTYVQKSVKENIVRMPVPRAAGSRMRNNYMTVSMSFDTTKKLILHYVKTLFRISKR